MNAFAGLQAQIGTQLRNGATQATIYAERIIARLDAMVDRLDSLDKGESERTLRTETVPANTSKKVVDGRAGYMMTIEQISVVAEAPTTVDIHVGTEGTEGFRTRLEATAGNLRPSGGLVGYSVPENSPVFAIVGGGNARVNIQLKRERVY